MKLTHGKSSDEITVTTKADDSKQNMCLLGVFFQAFFDQSKKLNLNYTWWSLHISWKKFRWTYSYNKSWWFQTEHVFIRFFPSKLYWINLRASNSAIQTCLSWFFWWFHPLCVWSQQIWLSCFPSPSWSPSTALTIWWGEKKSHHEVCSRQHAMGSGWGVG